MQIPGQKWFPLLKGETPSRAKRGEGENSARVSAPSCESHDASAS